MAQAISLRRTAGPGRVAGSDLEAHIRALRRYARALVSNPDDADDLVQETLKRALVYLDGSRDIRNLRAYLLTMLHHARVDLIKRRHREGEPLSVDSAPPLAAGPGQSDRRVCAEAVEAIERLPEDQRAVLLLVGIEDLAYQEVADVLGIPVGTVMSRLCRGRRALRRLMNLDGDDAGWIAGGLEGGAWVAAPARAPLLSSDSV